ncbi:hypothetical protein VPH35_053876 [Triticum aestivum]
MWWWTVVVVGMVRRLGAPVGPCVGGGCAGKTGCGGGNVGGPRGCRCGGVAARWSLGALLRVLMQVVSWIRRSLPLDLEIGIGSDGCSWPKAKAGWVLAAP